MSDNRKQSNFSGKDVLSHSSLSSAPTQSFADNTTFNLPIMPEGSNGAEFIQKGNYIIRGCGRTYEVEEVTLVDVQIPKEELEEVIVYENIGRSINQNIFVNNIVDDMEGLNFVREEEINLFDELLPEIREEGFEELAIDNLDDIYLIKHFEEYNNTIDARNFSVPEVTFKAVNDIISADFWYDLFFTNEGFMRVDVLSNDIFSSPVCINIIQEDTSGIVTAFVDKGAGEGGSDSLEFYSSDLQPTQPPAPGEQSFITYQISDGVMTNEALLTINWI